MAKRRGRPPVRVIISPSERTTLEQWARRRTTAQGLAQRARIILACAAGRSTPAIASELRITRQTVGRWRQRFAARRLDGLVDEPRPGAPRRITDAKVEQVIADTLETTPRDATQWSTRALAKQAGLSHSTVGRIWRAFGLQPHRSETFKLSRDPLFVGKVRDIVGLYLAPPDRALVLSVDEKSQIQALDRVAPILPMSSDRPSVGPTTIAVMGPPRCSRRSMSPPARSSANVIGGIGARSFSSSSRRSTPACPRISTCISFSTITVHTRLRASGGGSPGIRGFTSTSPRPAPRGSTSSSAGSRC